MRTVLAVLLFLGAAQARSVEFTRVPDGGIQPQLATDAKGVVHLIYFKGDLGAGDVYYVRTSASGHFTSADCHVTNAVGRLERNRQGVEKLVT